MMKSALSISAFRISRWTSAWLATATMVMSPVALGKESENISMQMMEAALQESGLNKSITLGEFYEKNKSLLSNRLQLEIEPVVVKFKNQKMPKFELTETKGSDGLTVPTIRVSQRGELVNLQWFGEDNKYLKMQNTELSKIDLINFNDMVVRVLAGDEKLRKNVKPLISNEAAKAPVRNFNFGKYPDMTKRDWAGMSEFDRAAYVVNLRLLWLDARKVISEKKKSDSKTKKTSKNFFEKNEKYFELIFGQDVEAQAKREKQKVVKSSGSSPQSSGVFTGDSCIVAGYVAKYSKGGREVCSHELIDQNYNKKDNSLYVNAKEACATTGRIACNPYIFGTPNGSPTCVTPSRAKDFQEATHFDGPCDRASRLQTSESELKLLKNDKLKAGRYDETNLIDSASARKSKLVGADGKENVQLTENYLLGILKFRKSIKSDATTIFEAGVLNDQILDQILIDKDLFDTEIQQATDGCRAESGKKHEVNYYKACDQLHRRFLMVEALFASKCAPGSNFDQPTLRCICTNPPGAKIIPGAQCMVPAPAPVIPPPEVSKPEPPPRESKRNCSAEFPDAGELTADCKCLGGSTPVQVASNGNQKSFSCNPQQDGIEIIIDKGPCGFMCSFTKNLPMIGLAILGSVVLYKVMEKVFAVKKPPLTNPGDGCPTPGQAPPCTPVCKAPLSMQSSGVCDCAQCPPGQAADKANSCNCSSTGTGTAVMFVCPDGITSKPDISQCPYYACNTTTPPTSYQNPSNCPTSSSQSAPRANPGTPGKTR